jgi:hypothetical protein
VDQERTTTANYCFQSLLYVNIDRLCTSCDVTISVKPIIHVTIAVSKTNPFAPYDSLHSRTYKDYIVSHIDCILPSSHFLLIKTMSL